jgi:hypothetical protein
LWAAILRETHLASANLDGANLMAAILPEDFSWQPPYMGEDEEFDESEFPTLEYPVR